MSLVNNPFSDKLMCAIWIKCDSDSLFSGSAGEKKLESPVWLPLCLPHTSHSLTWYHTLASPVTCPQKTTLGMVHIHACKSCHGVHFHHFLYIHHCIKNCKILSRLHTQKGSFPVPLSIHVWTFNCSVWWTTSIVCTDLSHSMCVCVCLHEVRMFNMQQTSQSMYQPTNAGNKIQFVTSIKLLHLLAQGCHS